MKASTLLFAIALSSSCQTSTQSKPQQPHQLSLTELQMCARDLSVYRSPKPESEPPKPPQPKHTTVKALRVGETAYTVALNSWNGKIYVFGPLDAYWQPTTYDGTRFNIAIRRTKAGFLADCSGEPFVIIEDSPDSGDLPIIGQFNLEEERRARK